jgi:hypothetical protein
MKKSPLTWLRLEASLYRYYERAAQQAYGWDASQTSPEVPPFCWDHHRSLLR